MGQTIVLCRRHWLTRRWQTTKGDRLPHYALDWNWNLLHAHAHRCAFEVDDSFRRRVCVGAEAAPAHADSLVGGVRRTAQRRCHVDRADLVASADARGKRFRQFVDDLDKELGEKL